MSRAEEVARTSTDLIAEQVERLREIFPEAFAEGKLDWDLLRDTLGEIIDGRSERYSFTWAGKHDSLRLLQTPSRATLVPCSEESMNWENTRNAFIEGENLEVLKLLYKAYFGRVKMIYIDPPYNTGNDFVYPDNYADPLDAYLQLTGQRDTEGNLLTSNPQTSGRYHSAWLSMMYPRLFLARQLLHEDGVIFVSIDDNEVHNLRMLMNEVFGEENFIECFVWKKTYGGGAKEKYAVTQHEYVLLYARAGDLLEDLWLPPDPETERRYYKYRDDKFETRGPYRLKPLEATKSMDRRDNLVFPIPLPQGGELRPRRQWWWSRDRVMRAIANDEIVFTGDGDSVSVSYKQYLRDESGEKRGMKPFSIIDGIYTQHGTDDLTSLFDGQVVMQFPKPVALMRRLLNIGMDAGRGDVVLDFFAGSCTTAQAVLELNREDGGDRRFVMVQLPEPLDAPRTLNDGVELRTIADIGRQRIRRVIQKLESAGGRQQSFEQRRSPEDLGFRAFRLAESNFRQWTPPERGEPEGYAEQMGMFEDPLLDNWTPERVIYEVALKEAGFGLNCRIERLPSVVGNTVWLVTDTDMEQAFRICLDDKLDPEAIRTLDLGKDDLFICRDVALNDELAANLALQCRLKTI